MTSSRNQNKSRLDLAVFERGLTQSREKARGMIMAGEVMVNGKVIDKPGTRIQEQDKITLLAKPQFVSRGGDKLAGALEDFAFSPAKLICADVGASTGGFTDCLLQHEAAKVYAIDVGYGQIAYPLRQDARVVVMERTNARYVKSLDEKPDLIVIDASFISLRLLLPVIKGWLHHKSTIIALVKPQFEAGKNDVGKGGVVRDESIHAKVLYEVMGYAENNDLKIRGITRSRLKGPSGNIEFFVWLSMDGQAMNDAAIATKISEITKSV